MPPPASQRPLQPHPAHCRRDQRPGLQLWPDCGHKHAAHLRAQRECGLRAASRCPACMPNLHQHGVLRMQADGTKGTTVAVSHNPDFTSLHEVGEKVYMLTHFEAPYPGGWVDGWVGRLVGACTQGWAGERAPAGPRSTPSPHAQTCTPPPPPPRRDVPDRAGRRQGGPGRADPSELQGEQPSVVCRGKRKSGWVRLVTVLRCPGLAAC